MFAKIIAAIVLIFSFVKIFEVSVLTVALDKILDVIALIVIPLVAILEEILVKIISSTFFQFALPFVLVVSI